MGRTRRKFSSEEKLKMVMAVIQDGKAVSDVAQENNVHPNMILNWKKEFLENAAMIFDRHRPDITEKAQQRKIEELETKLKKKDGYSRKILDWTLCENMEGINIELLVARVKEKYPEARARIIHDNGKQFISKDFKSLISLLELYETSARICHPQSNGKLERFHSTLKTEHVRKTPYFGYEDAKEKMAQWIDFYNNGRLHGALLYLTPADYFAGRKEVRLAERKEKLHTADINRKAYWLQQQHS